MDLEERVQRLERRLREMEDLLEDLQAAAGGHSQQAPSWREAKLAPPPPSRPIRRAPAPAPAPVPHTPAPAPAPSSSATSSRPSPAGTSPEEWIGRWGLLAVGVALVVLAAGYFVKLAIDRGWISPLLRCSGGAALGAALAYTGWRLYQRGLRTYGAALIGCGAAVAYVAVWAAVRLYGLLPQTVGLGLVALLSVAVFAIGRFIDIEALAAAAVLGAFAAPAMLGTAGNPDLLLLYSGFLGAGLGWVAERRWRITTFLIGLCFFVVGWTAAATPVAVFMYSVLGASAGLYVGLREGWPELRFLSFAGGWLLLGLAALRFGANQDRLVTAGALVLAAPIWWRGLRVSIWPGKDARGAENFYFYLTPWLLAWGLSQFAPAWLGAHRWVVWSVLAIPYLAAGYSKPRVPFAVVAAAALMLAVLRMSSGYGAVWGLLFLTAAWAALDHLLGRTDGRWYAAVAFWLALIHLLAEDLPLRGLGPAFRDAWALTFWTAAAVCAMLAAGLWRHVEPVPQTPKQARTPLASQSINLDEVLPFARRALWVVAAVMLFSGVTGELIRYFHQSALPPAVGNLTGGLFVSGWWVCFGMGVVALGLTGRPRSALVLCGVAVVLFAIVHLVAVDLPRRGNAPAFRDGWALVFWLTAAVVAGVAVWLWRRRDELEPWSGWDEDLSVKNALAPLGDLLWIVAGLMVFVGVTGELIRYFGQAPLPPATAHLASGLSVSAWWAVSAAALVVLGFSRGLRAPRVAGLLVSGLAVLKVIVWDLSELNALYRVASVLTLGLASLAVAYLYHRYAAGHERDTGGTVAGSA